MHIHRVWEALKEDVKYGYKMEGQLSFENQDEAFFRKIAYSVLQYTIRFELSPLKRPSTSSRSLFMRMTLNPISPLDLLRFFSNQLFVTPPIPQVTSHTSLHNKTVVITGANTGLVSRKIWAFHSKSVLYLSFQYVGPSRWPSPPSPLKTQPPHCTCIFSRIQTALSPYTLS